MPPVAKRRPAENDIRNRPAYTVAEAARFLKISAATLRTWVAGRNYPTARGARRWDRLITPASDEPALLSFWNLIEAHVLRGLRTNHAVQIRAVRKALAFAEDELGVERLLLRQELSTSGGVLFLERYGQLIELSASGQMAMKQIFDSHLRRVEWDPWKFPVRLFPFTAPGGITGNQGIAIDPAIAFGRPIVRSSGIRTEVLVERIDAGEPVGAVAADYGMTVEAVQDAIVYERAA